MLSMSVIIEYKSSILISHSLAHYVVRVQYKDSIMDPAFDSKGLVYVADTCTYNYRIQKFTPEARFVDILGTKGSKSGELSHPSGIIVLR